MSEHKNKVIHPSDSPSYYNEWKFSPAIESNGFVFVSGCTGTMDDGTVPDGIVAQTRQAFFKIKRCLDSANIDFTDIVEMTTYHVQLNLHLSDFIRAKGEFVVPPYPAWTAIGVTELASEGALIEVRVIAKSCTV